MEDLSIDKIPGYKPVRHHGCGGQIAWVKDEVQPRDRMRAEDALKLDGSIIEPNSRIDLFCPKCQSKIISPKAVSI